MALVVLKMLTNHVCNEFAAGIFGVREGWRARIKPAVDRYRTVGAVLLLVSLLITGSRAQMIDLKSSYLT